MWVCEDIVKGINNDIGNRHITTHNPEREEYLKGSR